MYVNAGYLNQTDAEIEAGDTPLVVESCGIYRLIRQPSMRTSRPSGRGDCQLLYIASGRAHFYLEDREHVLEAGHFIFYRPGRPQHYVYHAAEQPEICWVHFTGREAISLAELAGFTASSILYTGISPEFQQLFLRMIRELQFARPCFEEALSLLLRELLLLVRRSLLESPQRDGRAQREILEAIRFFQENFSSEIVIADYAHSHHLSACWFIRSFRQYTGVPPLRYLTDIRMERARFLLENTDYNIGEIGDIIGYRNPLYFSRIFKKIHGLSPAQYRKSHER